MSRPEDLRACAWICSLSGWEAGHNMEDDEVSENWEEAADSGVR